MAQKIELFPGDSSNWQVSSPPELRRQASLLLNPRAKNDRQIVKTAINLATRNWKDPIPSDLDYVGSGSFGDVFKCGDYTFKTLVEPSLSRYATMAPNTIAASTAVRLGLETLPSSEREIDGLTLGGVAVHAAIFPEKFGNGCQPVIIMNHVPGEQARLDEPDLREIAEIIHRGLSNINYPPKHVRLDMANRNLIANTSRGALTKIDTMGPGVPYESLSAYLRRQASASNV